MLVDRDVTLKYPLQFTSKYEIVQEVEQRRIPSSCIWTCEHPEKDGRSIKPCGNCVPCINLKLAKHELILRSGV